MWLAMVMAFIESFNSSIADPRAGESDHQKAWCSLLNIPDSDPFNSFNISCIDASFINYSKALSFEPQSSRIMQKGPINKTCQ